MDLGSTSNYIDAQECASRGIKVEAEDKLEELKMADGTMVKTKGRIHTKMWWIQRRRLCLGFP